MKLLSDTAFERLYIGQPVKSLNTGNSGFIEWIGESLTEPHLRADYICVCWESGAISEFPHHDYYNVIDLEP